jgi:Mg/Co/Ni transporter MgtE
LQDPACAGTTPFKGSGQGLRHTPNIRLNFSPFINFSIGVIIAFALIVNLLAGAFAGAVILLVLRRLGIDPAIAGGVVLTPVTDVVGIIAFLGLATLVLG